jgi:hypothetical protein
MIRASVDDVDLALPGDGKLIAEIHRQGECSTSAWATRS